MGLNPAMERVLLEGTVKEARAPEANNIAQGSKTGPLHLGLLRVRPFQQSPHKGRYTPRKIRSLRTKLLE